MGVFDDFEERGEALIQEFCSIEQEESVRLEFKESSGKAGRFSNDDRKNLGNELSALANSDGGVIIWGIKTAKTVGNLDRAREAVPIANIESFYAEAKRLCGEYLSPSHDGIRLSYSVSVDAPECGYLCIDVLRSERRPHMSRAKDDKRYYKRISDSAYIMEHFDIEDQMSRLQNAELASYWKARVWMRSGLEKHIGISLFLKNISHVTAENPYVDVVLDAFVKCRNQETGYLPVTRDNGWRGFVGDSRVINPGESSCAVSLEIKLVRKADGCWWFENSTSNRLIEYRFGCRNRQAKSEKIDLGDSKIVSELADQLKLDIIDL